MTQTIFEELSKRKPQLSDLRLQSIALELRYDAAFPLWDKAGQIASEIKLKIPELKLSQASPGNLAFTLANRYAIEVALEKSHIVAGEPAQNLEQFMQFAEIQVSAILRHLELSQFTRIGTRLVYMKQYPSRAEASRAALSLGLLMPLTEKFFGIEGELSLPEYKVRWESKSIGTYIQISASSVKVDLETPLEVKSLKSVHEEHHRFTFDVDYYTMAPVSVDKFRVKEWIENVAHVVRRDSHVFFERGDIK